MEDRKIKNKKRIVEEGYAKIAEKYNLKRVKSTRSLKLLETIVKKMPKKGKVLDVGCGAGYPVSQFFVKRGYGVTGIDLSNEMIKIAKKNVPEGNFIKQDMLKMNFPENTFNIIVSFFAIIHVPREQHQKILKKMYKLLKKQGILFISMGIEDLETDINNNWLGTKMYWSNFDKETNLKLVKKAGFKILWNKIIGPKNDAFVWILAKKE